MVTTLLPTTMTPEAYLAWELEQETKHEYEHGEIIDMTGGRLVHNKIAIRLILLIANHLRGQKDYLVLGSDAMVMTEAGVYYYPDVVVSNDTIDRQADDFLQSPCLIAEVLSPSTEGRDRGIKMRKYLKIDTLQEYLIIDPDYPRVECYRRSERSWQYINTAAEANELANFRENSPTIHLASIDLKFPLSDLYESIEFLP